MDARRLAPLHTFTKSVRCFAKTRATGLWWPAAVSAFVVTPGGRLRRRRQRRALRVSGHCAVTVEPHWGTEPRARGGPVCGAVSGAESVVRACIGDASTVGARGARISAMTPLPPPPRSEWVHRSCVLSFDDNVANKLFARSRAARTRGGFDAGVAAALGGGGAAPHALRYARTGTLLECFIHLLDDGMEELRGFVGAQCRVGGWAGGRGLRQVPHAWPRRPPPPRRGAAADPSLITLEQRCPTCLAVFTAAAVRAAAEAAGNGDELNACVASVCGCGGGMQELEAHVAQPCVHAVRSALGHAHVCVQRSRVTCARSPGASGPARPRRRRRRGGRRGGP